MTNSPIRCIASDTADFGYGDPEIHDCQADATVAVWRPKTDAFDPDHGTVALLCDFHATDLPDGSEVVTVASIAAITCVYCSEPVWFKHSEGHATGQPCDFCQDAAAEHPACSCPSFDEWLRVMEAHDSRVDADEATDAAIWARVRS